MSHSLLLHPEPLPLWQDTADPHLHMRQSNTERQLLLRTVGSPGAHEVWFEPSYHLCMGFDTKCDFAPPTILLGLLLCPWAWGIFFWWDLALSIGVVSLSLLQQIFLTQDWIRISCIAGRFFTNWIVWEAPHFNKKNCVSIIFLETWKDVIII